MKIYKLVLLFADLPGLVHAMDAWAYSYVPTGPYPNNGSNDVVRPVSRSVDEAAMKAVVRGTATNKPGTDAAKKAVLHGAKIRPLNPVRPQLGLKGTVGRASEHEQPDVIVGILYKSKSTSEVKFSYFDPRTINRFQPPDKIKDTDIEAKISSTHWTGSLEDVIEKLRPAADQADAREVFDIFQPLLSNANAKVPIEGKLYLGHPIYIVKTGDQSNEQFIKFWQLYV